MLNVAIIGCGAVAPKHIQLVLRMRSARLIAVCDMDYAKAQKTAQRFGVSRAYHTASELFEAERPDVVHIVTPPQSHKELALQAMAAGCHVLVEKPMALNLSEADDMIRASKHHNVRLGVCHNFLFEPAVVAARGLVDAGTIGKVISVEIFWRIYRGSSGTLDRYQTTPWLHDLPGGMFHETLPHHIYLQMAFLKSVKATAVSTKQTGSGLPSPSDELRVLFDGHDGIGYSALSSVIRPFQAIVRIYGADMTIQVDLTAGTLVKHRSSVLDGKFPNARVNADQALQLLSQTFSNLFQYLRRGRVRGHDILIKQMYESLIDGTPLPVSAEDGRAVVAILEDVWTTLRHQQAGACAP